MNGCRFCHLAARAPGESLLFVLRDDFPVSPGHTLVSPRRHCPDPFDLTEREIADAIRLIWAIRQQLISADPRIDGFNVGFNSGAAAGQTIMHAHWHVIPRRTGDTPDPRGGIRGAIPARMAY